MDEMLCTVDDKGQSEQLDGNVSLCPLFQYFFEKQVGPLSLEP